MNNKYCNENLLLNDGVFVVKEGYSNEARSLEVNPKNYENVKRILLNASQSIDINTVDEKSFMYLADEVPLIAQNEYFEIGLDQVDDCLVVIVGPTSDFDEILVEDEKVRDNFLRPVESFLSEVAVSIEEIATLMRRYLADELISCYKVVNNNELKLYEDVGHGNEIFPMSPQFYSSKLKEKLEKIFMPAYGDLERLKRERLNIAKEVIDIHLDEDLGHTQVDIHIPFFDINSGKLFVLNSFNELSYSVEIDFIPEYEDSEFVKIELDGDTLEIAPANDWESIEFLMENRARSKNRDLLPPIFITAKEYSMISEQDIVLKTEGQYSVILFSKEPPAKKSRP